MILQKLEEVGSSVKVESQPNFLFHFVPLVCVTSPNHEMYVRCVLQRVQTLIEEQHSQTSESIY